MQEEKIEIQLSKKKIKFSLIGALFFIGCGVWILLDPDGSKIPIFDNITFFYLSDLAGLAVILFFGSVAVALLLKIIDDKPGLIINYEGIVDNSSGGAPGMILWNDIQDIKSVRVLNERFIKFVLKNPDYYISREKNSLKKKAMQFNYKIYGSPINISPGLLSIDFESLKAILKKKLNEKITGNN